MIIDQFNRKMTMGLPPVVLDWETFYDPADKYSLTSMTYEEYVRDPRFQEILCSFYLPEEGEHWYAVGHKNIAAELRALRLHECAMVAHNNNFDGFILRDVHGIEAAEYICTLAMAKPHVGAKQSVSLAKLAELIGLPAKGKEVENVMGMRLEDFTPEGLKRYAAYGQRDDELCWGIFMKFRSFWDDMSMEIMSDTIRCGVVPQFQVDVPLLQGYLPLLEKRQKDLVDELAKDFGKSGEEMSKALGSNPRFAACLERLGVEPPTKVSEKTGKTSFAFAKTDMGFKELLESPDERVVTLCEARMGNKSSIGVSRAQRLIDIGRRGRLPMPLDAFGAGTSRWVALGGQKINVQNFPKRGGDITLRQSIIAPPGYHVVTCDLSQIEARRMAAQSGQWDLVEQFKHDLDPYSIFATELYGYPVSKHNGKKKERNVGKESILSMQYGSGGRAFWLRLRSAYNIYLEEDFCAEAVWKYRRKYKHITDFWNRCDQAIKVMRFGGEFAFGENDAYLAVKGGIYLPDDYFLKYDQIHEVEDKETGKNELKYMDRTKRSLRRLYRGIVANNVTQGSSARILQNHIKWLRDEGIFMCGTVHDELIFLVPDYDLEEQCALIESTMKRVPAWAEGTPVDCELTVGPNYGDQYDLPIYLEGGCTKLGAEAVIRERKRQAAN